MYAKGKGSTVPSDAQSREKLALYVYEYLIHAGAQKAAQTFLQEIRWEKSITLAEPPGFLHSWWSVFWDLYSAAPERRDTFEHSNEAKAFHDYGFVNPGFSNGMGHNPSAQNPLQMAPQDVGLPGPGPGGMPPGYFPPPGPMMSGLELRPMMGPMMVQHRLPHPGSRLPMPGYTSNMGPRGPALPPMPPRGTTPGVPVSVPGPMWMPASSSGSYSSASPVPFQNGPPSTGSGTPGVMPSPHHQQDLLYEMRGPMFPPHPGGGMHGMGEVMMPADQMLNGADHPGHQDIAKHSPVCPSDDMGAGPPSSMTDFGGVPYSDASGMAMCGGAVHPSHMQHPANGPGQPQQGGGYPIFGDQSDCAAIQKLKESMQEEAKMFEFSKELVDGSDYFMHQ